MELKKNAHATLSIYKANKTAECTEVASSLVHNVMAMAKAKHPATNQQSMQRPQ